MNIQPAENLQFPEKLKCLLEQHSDIITWGRQGSSITINATNLDEYLTSPSNTLFHSKHLSCFERQLLKYGFSKVTKPNQQLHHGGSKTTLKSELQALTLPILYEYRHHYFRADNINNKDLCENVREITTPQTITNSKLLSDYRRRKVAKKKNDVCLGQYENGLSNISRLNLARLRLRMILQTKLLENRIKRQMENCMATNSYVIELPEDSFDNTTESVFNINQKKFAGFYGNVANTYVSSYFGSYLPIYTENGPDNSNVIVKEKKLPPTSHTIVSNHFQFDVEEPLSPIHEPETTIVPKHSLSEFTEIHYDNHGALDDATLRLNGTCGDDDAATMNSNKENEIITPDDTSQHHKNNETDEIMIKLENGQCEPDVSDMFKEIRDSISILYN